MDTCCVLARFETATTCCYACVCVCAEVTLWIELICVRNEQPLRKCGSNRSHAAWPSLELALLSSEQRTLSFSRQLN